MPTTVLQTIHWCGKRKLDFELIIADDGSQDDTLAIARLFEQSDGRIRALACPHIGKGAAVRIGMLVNRERLLSKGVSLAEGRLRYLRYPAAVAPATRHERLRRTGQQTSELTK